MKKLCLVIMVIIAVVWIALPVVAQDSDTITAEFVSIPIGAEVTLNGELLGVTPLTVGIAPGVYHVSFTLAGFREWSDTVIFAVSPQNIRVHLQGGDSLTEITYPPAKFTWSHHQHQLRFRPYLGENVESTYVTWDFDTNSIKRNSLPLDLLEDDELRHQLDIQNNDGTIIEAYTSPSGRYITFPQRTGEMDRNDREYWELKIYDRETQTIYKTQFLVYDPIAQVTDATFKLFWSPDETVVGIEGTSGSTTEGARFYLFINDDQAETYVLHSFTTEIGEEVFVEDIISPPSNQGQVFVYNVVSSPERPTRNLWLVDIVSLTGIRVPIDGVFDVAFSPLDSETIIVAHEGGISRVSMPDFTESELITNVISTQWDVHLVDFSPTAEYALVGTSPDFISTYWLYKLPDR